MEHDDKLAGEFNLLPSRIPVHLRERLARSIEEPLGERTRLANEVDAVSQKP